MQVLMMNEIVAVIVLSHNSWETSEKFLSNFSSYTDLNRVKLVWIDNGSSDNSPTNLKKHVGSSIHKLITKDSNYGVIGGRNFGFDWFLNDQDAQDCTHLLIIDNDQFVKENWLEHHLSVLKQGYDLIGVEAWLMSSNFLPIAKVESIQKRFTYVGCGGSLMKRSVPETIGGYDERFNPCYFEDPDYNFRAMEAGFKIGWNYKAKINHVPHQTLGHVTDKREYFIKSLKEFRKKWRGKKTPSLLQRYLPEFDK